jgi:general secretion pathway protein K
MWNSRIGRCQARRGGILLAVLWLSAALGAIAYSVASTVRAETERSSTLADGIRTHYLARAGADRMILHMLARLAQPIPSRAVFRFPTGVAIAEIIPETSRLSLNQAGGDQFVRLLLALGAEPPRAAEIAAALVDWRSPGSRLFDSYYLSLRPSFLPRHASFQDVEEALYVRGMTTELFHGNYIRDPQGRLVRLGGFKECVSVYGAIGPLNRVHAEPALLLTLGVPPDQVRLTVEARRAELMGALATLGAQTAPVVFYGPPVHYDGHTIFTVRSTARLLLANAGPRGSWSDLSRTVSAQVKFRRMEVGPPPYQVLRWWDSAEPSFAASLGDDLPWR